MSNQTTLINVSEVAQTVPGYGETPPGQTLLVDQAVAAHLLKSEAWEEPKAPKNDAGRKAAKEAQAEAPAEGGQAQEEVTNGAA